MEIKPMVGEVMTLQGSDGKSTDGIFIGVKPDTEDLVFLRIESGTLMKMNYGDYKAIVNADPPKDDRTIRLYNIDGRYDDLFNFVNERNENNSNVAFVTVDDSGEKVENVELIKFNRDRNPIDKVSVIIKKHSNGNVTHIIEEISTTTKNDNQKITAEIGLKEWFDA